MLQRNLIAVLAVGLVFLFASNAFGQESKRKVKRKISQVSVGGFGGGVDDNRRVSKRVMKRPKYSPKIRQAQDVFVTERRSKPKIRGKIRKNRSK